MCEVYFSVGTYFWYKITKNNGEHFQFDVLVVTEKQKDKPDITMKIQLIMNSS
jgi:hypothetical protein